MREKPVKLSDIARRLELSTVTISKALRDHPDISVATKRLVRAAAEEMGYTPNLIARSLSARRSQTIGVVLPKIAHFFFSSIIDHIYNIAFARRYEVILTVSQENAERERKHIQTLLAMKVDGIIASISQETCDYTPFEQVVKRGVPLVFVDRVPELHGTTSVVVDDCGGATKAVDHAIGLGYRRIGYVGGVQTSSIGRERMRGFSEAMRKHGIEINGNWVVEGGFDEESGYEGFMKIHRQGDMPDFLFAVTYPVALGIYRGARQVGKRIPDDVDLICFGNTEVQNYLCPPLSSIDQPTHLLSRHAMELLFEHINHREDFTPRRVVVETELVLRETCRVCNRPRE